MVAKNECYCNGIVKLFNITKVDMGALVRLFAQNTSDPQGVFL